MKITSKCGEHNNKGMRPHVDHDDEGWVYTLFHYDNIVGLGATSACFMDHGAVGSVRRSIILYRSVRGGWYVGEYGTEQVEPTKYPSRRVAWAAARMTR